MKPYVMPMLMAMMFFSCLKINIADFKTLPKNLWRFAIILAMIFLLPVLGVWLFRNFMDHLVFAGLILAASMPAGIAVVFLSDVLGGEPAKAMVSTALAHILAPVVSPFLVWFFVRKTVDINLVGMMVLIAKLVLIPFVAAQALKLLRLHGKFILVSKFTNNLLLFLIVLGIIAPARSLILNAGSQLNIAVAVVAAVVVTQVFLAILFGRTHKEDVTWSVVSTFKNFTLSSVIAMSAFGPSALLGSVAYIIVDNLALIPISIFSKFKK